MTQETKDAPPMALMRLDPQALLSQAVDKGATIETLERLVALAKDVRAMQAKEAWLQAMAIFQRTCPPILRTETAKINTAKGSYTYSYAPMGEIMGKITEPLTQNGLSVSFRYRYEPNQVIVNCRISHVMGHHEESGEVAMPIVQDGTGANPAQRVGIASTYAERYALKAILALSAEDDPDAQHTGSDAPSVAMPQRASEAAKAPPAAPAQAAAPPGRERWQGLISTVREKTGETKGKAWTLYTIVGADHTEFGTFDAKDAKFAREAGMSEVVIVWETTAKGGKRIVGIEPAGAWRDPADEGPDA